VARKKQESAAHTLEEIESFGDKLAGWAGDNPALILGAAALILVLAGGYGLISANQNSHLDASAAALAKVQSGFRTAMGADFSALSVAEPANPETARAVRREYIDRYREVAQEHDGTTAAALALLEVGALQNTLGNLDAAKTTWREARSKLPPEHLVGGLLLGRIAAAEEKSGNFLAAAEAYQAAAEIPGNPLRYVNLVEAARCFAAAGESSRALQAFDQVEAEAPDHPIPSHANAILLELRAQRAS